MPRHEAHGIASGQSSSTIERTSVSKSPRESRCDRSSRGRARRRRTRCCGAVGEDHVPACDRTMTDLENELADGHGVAPDEPATGHERSRARHAEHRRLPGELVDPEGVFAVGTSIGTPVRSAISATPPQWSTWPWVTSTFSSVARFSPRHRAACRPRRRDRPARRDSCARRSRANNSAGTA